MSPTTSLFNTTKVIDLSLGFGDQDTVLDPSALILSFGIAIGILPIIVVVVIGTSNISFVANTCSLLVLVPPILLTTAGFVADQYKRDKQQQQQQQQFAKKYK